MKRVLFLTAYNRPDYLKETLESWSRVRGLENWHVVFSIDNSEKLPEVIGTIQGWLPFFEERTRVEVSVNPDKFGVLHHPWVLFDRLFNVDEYDYVMRAEDDITVTSDILEYHVWASEQYCDDPQIGWITSFADDYRDHAAVQRRLGFGSPLIIGTWAKEWSEVFGPTWDHDYSTHSGIPGVHAGWDHNLHLRVMPARGLHSIIPLHTKVYHLGVHGQHSTPDVYFQAPLLETDVAPQQYHET